MSTNNNEFEALEKLGKLHLPENYNYLQVNETEEFNIVRQTLLELKQIKETKPSETMVCLENIEADLTGLRKHVTEYDDGFDSYLEDIWNNIDTIEQYLLNAQKNARSEETLQKYYQEGITLDSVRALKQERDNYKKAFAVVWRKPTQIRAAVAYFRSTLNPTYEDYCTTIMSEDQLTKEEFEIFREVGK